MCVPGASCPLTEHSKPDGTRDTNTGDSGGQRTKCRTQGAQEPGPARWPGPRVFPRAGRLATARSSLAGAGSAVACCSRVTGRSGAPLLTVQAKQSPVSPSPATVRSPELLPAGVMQGHHGATTSPCGQPRGPCPRRHAGATSCKLATGTRLTVDWEQSTGTQTPTLRGESGHIPAPDTPERCHGHRPRREVPARPRAHTMSASRPPESRLSHQSGGTSSPSERKIAAEAGAGQERCWTSRWIPTTPQRAVRPR